MKKFIWMASLLASVSFGTVLIVIPQPAAADHHEDAAKHAYSVIDAAALEKMIKEEKNLVIIDSRGEKYMGDGTIIKGAKHLGADKTDAESLAKLLASKDTPVAFYCSDVNCPASESAAHKATELGYTRVYKYPGGLADWKEKKLPTDKL